jgi:hypothetical protein
VPASVLAPTFTVSVLVPPAVIDAAENAAVAPLGSPATDSATDCAAPDVTAVEIVLCAVPPCAEEIVAGFAVIEKSGGPLIVSPTVVVCTADVPVPVTVRL